MLCYLPLVLGTAIIDDSWIYALATFISLLSLTLGALQRGRRHARKEFGFILKLDSAPHQKDGAPSKVV